MKKQYDKLSQPSVQRYSPALTLDRIWAINADEHFADPINIEALAHKFGLSSQYMRTIFHRTINMTPVRFIVEMRIKSAKELLTTSDMKIETVAQRVGFANQYYFSRCFKQHTGVTPRRLARKELPVPKIVVYSPHFRFGFLQINT